MKIEYIYWFANYNKFSPSVRYRGIYPLEVLKKRYNVGSIFIYPGYTWINIWRFTVVIFELLFYRKKNSLIVIESVYTQWVYASILKILVLIHKKHTLYDMDDAEYERFPSKSIHFFIKHCSACSVGSQTLLDYAKRLNKNTFLLTSPVIEHHSVKNNRNEVLTIGWIGFFSAHKVSLYKDFFPSLTLIGIPVKLVILGINKEKDIQELKAYYRAYSNIVLEIPGHIDWYDEASIYERISQFDIGISTLLDNELNRAKSAFKLKQYMSCGVPVLGSNIGENAKFLTDGVNGFICNHPLEYKDKILEIQSFSEEAYFKLSKNAKQSSAQFDVENYCDTLLNFFQGI